MMNPVNELMELDQRHVWHPYAAMPNQVPCFPVKSAEGVWITLEDGRTLVDGMSSWWACIHGYHHKVLHNAAQQQLDQVSHVMFGGLTHEPSIKLATQLVEVTPQPLQHVFFSDSGSVAVEVAMKMAMQVSQKSKFLTIRGGYHGDTFHCMSVCDPLNGMHHLFSETLPQQLFADRPKIPFHGEWNERDITSFHDLIRQHHDDIAAVILEPIVQGAGGMHFYSPSYLRRVRELCDEYEVLLILDEIATGFGRTGKLFACEHANVTPDIMCLGKALSGGMLSFAATLATTEVASRISNHGGVLMHGPTFMGNPLACAVSLASLQVLQSYDWQDKVSRIQEQLREELAPCKESPLVQDVRVLGAIGVVEMKEPFDMKVAQPAVVKQGVWLRPFGKLLYTMPPFIIERNELRRITQAMVALTRRRLK